ncbi:MAG: glycosyltransferase [Vampirovibrio sp.]|nr:glycosyltransferase [Vampirovibrio sp.]
MFNGVRKNSPHIRIGIVLDKAFPIDWRTEQQAKSLVKAGYEVHILCVQTHTSQPAEELMDGIHIHRVRPEAVSCRLPFFNVKSQLPYQGLLKKVNQKLWNIDTVWHTLISRLAERYQIDVFHVSNLRLVGTALDVGGKYGLRVVADLREHYPLLPDALSPQEALASRKEWQLIEKFSAWGVDRILTVHPGSRDRLVKHGIRPQKMALMPKAIDADHFLSIEPDLDITRQFHSNFLVTYVGPLDGRHRGVQTILDAVILLKREIPELKFVALSPLGSGHEQYVQELIASRVQRHGLHQDAFVFEQADEEVIASIMQASDLCVCPYLETDETRWSLPESLLLYHLFKKPILASNTTLLQHYIEESGGGDTFKAEDTGELATKIGWVYLNDKLRREWGEQGHHHVMTHHRWNDLAPQFVQLYDDMLRRKRHTHGPVLTPKARAANKKPVEAV